MASSSGQLLPNCTLDVFRCLSCNNALLSDREDLLRCRQCGNSWPVRDGIPRFFEPSYYWGEIPQPEAAVFLREASEKGWHAAAMERFSGDRDMQISLTDWQRASWLPLLGLDENSVALDIGCGYGAITQTLARAAGQVFALEAMPERIEFTRIRLSQESISNVHLVQASALDPPFSEHIFDLMVVNGILEWVGEWGHSGDPRDVQVGFLRRLSRMLKPEGILLIGIENRFSYYSPGGAIDHSGLPYTNLMPRRVASWWLKRVRRIHNRTNLNPKREYRTYTYGAQGYRKLLVASGFPFTTIYWPDPDYNQPHCLVPLCDQLIADYVDTLLSEPSLPRRYGAWEAAKRLLARSGAMRHMVPSFVIFASHTPVLEHPRIWRMLSDSIPGMPAVRTPLFLLTSNPFGRKSVVRVFESGARQPACIIKTTSLAPGGGSSLDREHRHMQIVNECIGSLKDAHFSVPHLLGYAQLGSFVYQAESSVKGLPISRMAFAATGRKRRDILLKALPLCVQASIQIGQALAREGPIEPVDLSWLRPPDEIAAEPALVEQLRRLITRCPSDAVQHGDFTLENLVWDGAESLAVIDWEHLFRGGSPLHDLFTLFVSFMLGDAAPAGPAHFEAVFFGRSWWREAFWAALEEACRALAISASNTDAMLVHFLLLRFHQLKARQSPLAKDHAAFLAAALRQGRPPFNA